tara:strand:- start:45 stop:998 length:954 start_codon:yes stop_codon:yes gene_type:complete
MRIVILGYKGLIGKSILKNLSKNTSNKIICVGRTIKKKKNQNANINYIKWDFNTFDKHNLFFLKKADIIINCVGKLNNDEDELKKINILFLKKFIKYLIYLKLKVRIVHLSSVSVYGGAKSYFGKNKLIKETSTIKTNDLYSESKLKSDKIIKNSVRKNLNKNLSFTILRISNVFGGEKRSNLINFILISLKLGFWIRTSKNVMYNFINVHDVSQVVQLIISKLKISKNKTYIVSDDCKQYEVVEMYKKFYKNKIRTISIPFFIVKFLIFFFPLPKKLLNFSLTISSKVSYSNEKIRKELNFKPTYSFSKKINYKND